MITTPCEGCGAKEVKNHKCTYCGVYRTIRTTTITNEDVAKFVRSYKSEPQGQRRSRKATRK